MRAGACVRGASNPTSYIWRSYVPRYLLTIHISRDSVRCDSKTSSARSSIETDEVSSRKADRKASSFNPRIGVVGVAVYYRLHHLLCGAWDDPSWRTIDIDVGDGITRTIKFQQLGCLGGRHLVPHCGCHH